MDEKHHRLMNQSCLGMGQNSESISLERKRALVVWIKIFTIRVCFVPRGVQLTIPLIIQCKFIVLMACNRQWRKRGIIWWGRREGGRTSGDGKCDCNGSDSSIPDSCGRHWEGELIGGMCGGVADCGFFALQQHEQCADGTPSLVGVTWSRILWRINLKHQNFLKTTGSTPNQSTNLD